MFSAIFLGKWHCKPNLAAQVKLIQISPRSYLHIFYNFRLIWLDLSPTLWFWRTEHSWENSWLFQRISKCLHVDIVKFMHGHRSCLNPLQLNTLILFAAWTHSGLLCFFNCSEESKYLSITHLYPLQQEEKRKKNKNKPAIRSSYIYITGNSMHRESCLKKKQLYKAPRSQRGRLPSSLERLPCYHTLLEAKASALLRMSKRK